MNDTIKSMQDLAPSLGINIERVVRGKHYKLYLSNKHGERGVLMVSVCQSALNGRNEMAAFKRFARKGEKR
jgi:hypothetical protein